MVPASLDVNDFNFLIFYFFFFDVVIFLPRSTDVNVNVCQSYYLFEHLPPCCPRARHQNWCGARTAGSVAALSLERGVNETLFFRQ